MYIVTVSYKAFWPDKSYEFLLCHCTSRVCVCEQVEPKPLIALLSRTNLYLKSQDSHVNTPLMLACSSDYGTEFLEFLIGHGANPFPTTNKHDGTLLHAARHTRNTGSKVFVLSLGIDITQRTAEERRVGGGETVLRRAAKIGDL